MPKTYKVSVNLVSTFFFDSLGVVHLPLLGCAAWRGKANISLSIPVIPEDIDVRACLQIILINFRRGCMANQFVEY
jgi:hypothetical protein